MEELLTLKQDISRGAPLLQKVIDQQLQVLETSNCKMCAHCGTSINEAYNHNMTFTFGPSDFRKKATLCGMDCLDQFLNKIRSINEKHLVQE